QIVRVLNGRIETAVVPIVIAGDGVGDIGKQLADGVSDQQTDSVAERFFDSQLHRVVTRASRRVVDQAHAGELRVWMEQLPARHGTLRQGPGIDDSKKWVVD